MTAAELWRITCRATSRTWTVALSTLRRRAQGAHAALGNAVNAALEQLVPVISQAPAPI